MYSSSHTKKVGFIQNQIGSQSSLPKGNPPNIHTYFQILFSVEYFLPILSVSPIPKLKLIIAKTFLEAFLSQDPTLLAL